MEEPNKPTPTFGLEFIKESLNYVHPPNNQASIRTNELKELVNKITPSYLHKAAYELLIDRQINLVECTLSNTDQPTVFGYELCFEDEESSAEKNMYNTTNAIASVIVAIYARVPKPSFVYVQWILRGREIYKDLWTLSLQIRFKEHNQLPLGSKVYDPDVGYICRCRERLLECKKRYKEVQFVDDFKEVVPAVKRYISVSKIYCNRNSVYENDNIYPILNGSNMGKPIKDYISTDGSRNWSEIVSRFQGRGPVYVHWKITTEYREYIEHIKISHIGEKVKELIMFEITAEFYSQETKLDPVCVWHNGETVLLPRYYSIDSNFPQTLK